MVLAVLEVLEEQEAPAALVEQDRQVEQEVQVVLDQLEVQVELEVLAALVELVVLEVNYPCPFLSLLR